MSSRATWMSLFTVAVGLLPTAMAQICTPEDGYRYLVGRQSDLDEITAKCTTVNGSIAMTVNYTGSFHLPNIRNITNGLRWSLTQLENETPETTSIDLPDLEFLGGSLEISDISTLQSFTAPKLETVEWAANIQCTQEVDLRSLVDLEYLTIIGNISSLRLDSLRQVRQDMTICNKDGGCNPVQPPSNSLNISLPALHDAGHIFLKGRFSDLATPNLTNLTGFGNGFYNFKLLTAGGPPINVSFPELKYIQGEGLWLEGNISNISIPEITNMTVWFSVDAYDELDINLPFQEAQDIILTGNITGVQFPNLTSVDIFNVQTVASLDCDSVRDTIMTATNTTEYNVHCGTSSLGSHFDLNLGATVAFVVVVGAFVGLA